MAGEDLLITLNRVLRKVGVAPVRSIDEFDSTVLLNVFRRLFIGLPTSVHSAPVTQREHKENFAASLDHLSQSVLMMDLSHISAEDLAKADGEATRNLLEILDELNDIFQSTGIRHQHASPSATPADPSRKPTPPVAAAARIEPAGPAVRAASVPRGRSAGSPKGPRGLVRPVPRPTNGTRRSPRKVAVDSASPGGDPGSEGRPVSRSRTLEVRRLRPGTVAVLTRASKAPSPHQLAAVVDERARPKSAPRRSASQSQHWRPAGRSNVLYGPPQPLAPRRQEASRPPRDAVPPPGPEGPPGHRPSAAFGASSLAHARTLRESRDAIRQLEARMHDVRRKAGPERRAGRSHQAAAKGAPAGVRDGGGGGPEEDEVLPLADKDAKVHGVYANLLKHHSAELRRANALHAATTRVASRNAERDNRIEQIRTQRLVDQIAAWEASSAARRCALREQTLPLRHLTAHGRLPAAAPLNALQCFPRRGIPPAALPSGAQAPARARRSRRRR